MSQPLQELEGSLDYQKTIDLLIQARLILENVSLNGSEITQETINIPVNSEGEPPKTGKRKKKKRKKGNQSAVCVNGTSNLNSCHANTTPEPVATGISASKPIPVSMCTANLLASTSNPTSKQKTTAPAAKVNSKSNAGSKPVATSNSTCKPNIVSMPIDNANPKSNAGSKPITTAHSTCKPNNAASPAAKTKPKDNYGSKPVTNSKPVLQIHTSAPVVNTKSKSNSGPKSAATSNSTYKPNTIPTPVTKTNAKSNSGSKPVTINTISQPHTSTHVAKANLKSNSGSKPVATSNSTLKANPTSNQATKSNSKSNPGFKPVATSNPTLPIESNPSPASTVSSKKNRKKQPQLPPHLMIDTTEKYLRLIGLLNKTSVKYKTEHVKGTYRVQAATMEDYKACVALYETVEIEFVTPDLKEEKTFKVVLRGILPCYTEEEIMDELKTLNYPVLSAKYIEKDNTRLPLVYLRLSPTVRGYSIMKLDRLFFFVVSVELLKDKRLIGKCDRCLEIGHEFRECNRPWRCIFCGESHLSTPWCKDNSPRINRVGSSEPKYEITTPSPTDESSEPPVDTPEPATDDAKQPATDVASQSLEKETPDDVTKAALCKVLFSAASTEQILKSVVQIYPDFITQLQNMVAK